MCDPAAALWYCSVAATPSQPVALRFRATSSVSYSQVETGSRCAFKDNLSDSNQPATGTDL